MKRSLGAVILSSLLTVPSAAQIIVDHPPHPAGGAASDTEFVNLFGQAVWQVEADDFQLTAPATARRLEWFGFYDRDNPPVSETMQIRLYDARPSDGLPGSVLHEFTAVNPTRFATGRIIGVGILPREFRYEFELPTPVSFAAGTPYWLSVVQQGDLTTAWYWEISIAELSGRAFMNPNFLDWRGTGTGDADLAFRLVVPEPGMSVLVCAGLLGACAGRRAR